MCRNWIQWCKVVEKPVDSHISEWTSVMRFVSLQRYVVCIINRSLQKSGHRRFILMSAEHQCNLGVHIMTISVNVDVSRIKQCIEKTFKVGMFIRNSDVSWRPRNKFGSLWNTAASIAYVYIRLFKFVVYQVRRTENGKLWTVTIVAAYKKTIDKMSTK